MTSGIPTEKELSATQEVAEYLGVERTTIQRWCRAGQLRGLKIDKDWRIRQEALENILKQSENSADIE
jgi:excisionase family DNA binding protein